MEKNICECGKEKYACSKLCWECARDEDRKADFEYSKEFGEVSRDEEIMCPYCGWVDDYTSEMHDEDEFFCGECEKTSELSKEYTTTWTTKKKEE